MTPRVYFRRMTSQGMSTLLVKAGERLFRFKHYLNRESWLGFRHTSIMTANGQKTLSFDEYDAYGFDIDHTLAKYNIPHLFTDCYSAIAKHLVDKNGYPKDILSFDRDFFTRGLVLDIEKGNFLKLAQDGTVLRASHGTKFLSDEKIRSIYGPEKCWKHFEELISNVDNISKFWLFENFFDMPIGAVCARIIDCLDAKSVDAPVEYNYWNDVRDATDSVYNPKHFAAGEGDFFRKFKCDTAYYVQPLSDSVKRWLKNLRQQGNKKLFVLTSSYADFAAASLAHVCGPDWQDYFDLYLSLAKKPSFFTSNRPFKRLGVSATKFGDAVSELEEREFYVHGNSSTLLTCLAKLTGKETPKVLFFGDSMRSDVSSTKRFVNWDTALVLEEMEAEDHAILSVEEGNADTNGSYNLIEPSSKRQRLHYAIDDVEKEFLTSKQWGSIFTDDHVVANHVVDGKHYMNTLWGYVIRKYADIAIPQLELVADLPLEHRFPVFNHELARTWGFYPRIPRALRTPHPHRINSSDNDNFAKCTTSE